MCAFETTLSNWQSTSGMCSLSSPRSLVTRSGPLAPGARVSDTAFLPFTFHPERAVTSTATGDFALGKWMLPSSAMRTPSPSTVTNEFVKLAANDNDAKQTAPAMPSAILQNAPCTPLRALTLP